MRPRPQHCSVLALWVLRGKDPVKWDFDLGRLRWQLETSEGDRIACSRQHSPGGKGLFQDVDAKALVEGRGEGLQLPTCEKCCVLMDQAMEERDGN